MSGWFRCETDGHERRRLLLLERLGSVDRDTAIDDLRIYQDQVLHAVESGRPFEKRSAADFAERWGWPKTTAYRLLVNHAAWSDPSRLEAWNAIWNDRGTMVERPRNDSGTEPNGRTVAIDETRNESGTTAERSWNESGHTRGDTTPPSHPHPHPQEETQKAPPAPPASVLPLDLPKEEADPVPQWARKPRRPAGVTVREVLTETVRAIEAIRQAPVKNPKRCGTDAAEFLRLWKALEHPPLAELADRVDLIARAARECPDKLFARNIRAEGWAEGTDRSRSVKTLCTQANFGDRLAAAQAWKRAGFPSRDSPPGLGLHRHTWRDPRTDEERAEAEARAMAAAEEFRREQEAG